MTQRGTTIRNVRVSEELWSAAKAKTVDEGTTLTAVIVEALQNYVEDDESS